MVADYFSMKDKTVIFTGGSGNLGQVMVGALLDYGAKVAVLSTTDRFPQDFSYRKNGQFTFIKADLSSTEGVQEGFSRAVACFGSIDVLVNCAAYGGGTGGKNSEYRLDKISDETWAHGIDGTLDVTFRCTREILKYFGNGGNIVNIASMYGLVAPDFSIYGDTLPWSPPQYGVGKAGVLQFTRYCASALSSRNIRVNCLTPGPFPQVTAQSDMAFINRLSDKTMLGRVGKADELCGALLLLCSDASSYMTGSNIVVDGGMTQRA